LIRRGMRAPEIAGSFERRREILGSLYKELPRLPAEFKNACTTCEMFESALQMAETKRNHQRNVELNSFALQEKITDARSRSKAIFVPDFPMLYLEFI
jgi:hypothetical protein